MRNLLQAQNNRNRFASLITASLLFAATQAQAVTSAEQIERLSEVYGALLDYRPAALPGTRKPGQFEISVEADLVPSIDNRIGAKTEPVQTPPVIGRLRVDWNPTAEIRLGAFVIPPVTVQNNTATLFGLQAAYSWGSEQWRSSLRGQYTQGTVKGPFSATDAADRFDLAAAGVDWRTGWFSNNWALYGGLGRGSNQTRFNIGADGAVIDGTHTYTYALIGIGWQNGPWTFIGEQQHTFSYLSNIILSVSHAF